jgi:metal-responsive CopG/Arc/MetJ family transcriptional regulator
MKPVQVMLDPVLLALFDATEEVQREGRSAVLRRALAEYLERRRQRGIRERYRTAYANADGIAEDLSGWADEGTCPDE